VAATDIGVQLHVCVLDSGTQYLAVFKDAMSWLLSIVKNILLLSVIYFPSGKKNNSGGMRSDTNLVSLLAMNR
jgi:hypothetical protein